MSKAMAVYLVLATCAMGFFTGAWLGQHVGPWAVLSLPFTVPVGLAVGAHIGRSLP